MKLRLKLTAVVLGVAMLAACSIPWNTIISVAEGIANIVIVVDPSAAAFAEISQVAVQGLQLIEADIASYKADKTNTGKLAALQAAIDAFQQNLPAELQAAHVKDPAKQAQLSAAVNLILDFVDGLASQFPQTAAQTMTYRAKRGLTTIPKPMDKKDIENRWRTEVCGADLHCASLVK